MWEESLVSRPRDQLEDTARRALAAARDPRKATAVAAAGAAAVAARLGIDRLRNGDEPSFDSDAYRFLPGEPVSAAVKRVVSARVDDAIAHLRGEAETKPAEAVHEARKDIKKIRSALRVVRAEIGDDTWRLENDHYRDCARRLSGSRDAEVMVEALGGLGERFGPPTRDRFDRLRRELEQENRAAHEDGSIERAMATSAAELEAGRVRIDALPIEGDGWDLIGPGLQRSYRRARNRLRDAEEQASVTNLHELRKRVKDLWYQLRLIRDADSVLIGSLADHAHDLSDHLGDDHDLALLREQVQRRAAAFTDPADQRHLLEQIDQRRAELQFAAISLGERIYDEKPKRFAKRLEKRWEAWRDRKPVAA
jgi:CHAD domain-containing protein